MVSSKQVLERTMVTSKMMNLMDMGAFCGITRKKLMKVNLSKTK